MLLLALVPPAFVQPAPLPPKGGSVLLEALEAIPQAYIEGREGDLHGHILDAKRHWELVRKAHVVPEGEVAHFDQTLEALPAQKPRLQAEAALMLAGIVSAQMRPCRAKACLGAELATMLAWCRVESRNWETVPNVAEAFHPLVESSSARHPVAARQVMDCLAALQENLSTRSVTGAKRDLRELLSLVERLEKP